MKQFVAIFFLFLLQFAYSQEVEPKLTISFSDTPLENAIEEIENSANLKFFFQKDWIKGITVSGEYQNQEITTILDDLLNETLLNYLFIKPDRVVLTQNILIYDTLPIDFFGKTEVQEVPRDTLQLELVTPIFLSQQNNNSPLPRKTVRVGKVSKESSRKTFTLSGKVLNSKNNQPVPDLAIIVEGSNRGTSTDDEGNYNIQLPAGENMLMTQGLGFLTSFSRILIYDDGSHDFIVDESYEQLDEVVVEAEIDKNVEEVVTGVTVIEVEKIKNIPLVLGERDILKAALTLPGISNAGEGASGYNVRGGRTDQNLIMLDNGVLYNPSHFFGIFSAINPFTTGSATIYKGHIPAEYGGRLSSVFDMKTKDGNFQKVSGEASIGPVTSNAVIEVPVVKDKASLLVGGRATYSDWILRSLDNEDLQNSEASFFDVVAKYTHIINDKNKIDVTGYYSRDAFSITSDSIFDYSNRLVSLNWDHRFNDKNTLSLSAATSEYGFGIEFDANSTNDFDLGYNNNETEVQLKMRHSPNEKHSLNFGLASKLYTVNPGSVDPIGSESLVAPLALTDEKGLESAIFLSDAYKVNEKLLIDAGIRYSLYFALGPGVQRRYQENAPRNNGTLTGTEEFDNNEIIETYGGPEIRVSTRYFLSDDFSIKASFNNSFQYIHTLSSNTTVSPTDTWKLSDINIEPQRANQVSLGLYKNFDGNTYELSLEGYYKEQKNLLDYKTGAQLLLNETLEQEVLQGDGRAYGVEFLVRKNNGRLNGWLGYTYSRSFVRLDSEFSEERVNNGEYFPSNYDKPHDLSIVANYKFTKRLSASANFSYQTGRPVTYPVGSFSFNNSEFVFYSDRNEFRIPDYYRLDLSFNMEGNHKIKKFAHSFWSFSIYNVLGRNNPYSVFFVTDNGEIKAFQSSIFAIPVPTITYNFKF